MNSNKIIKMHDTVFALFKHAWYRNSYKIRFKVKCLNSSEQNILIFIPLSVGGSGDVGIHTNPHPSWPYTQRLTFQIPFE